MAKSKWHPDVYNLAHSIAIAYAEAVHGMTPAVRALLSESLVPAVAELLIASRTHVEIGEEIGGSIEHWERRFSLPSGPRRFVVKSVHDVVVAPAGR